MSSRKLKSAKDKMTKPLEQNMSDPQSDAGVDSVLSRKRQGRERLNTDIRNVNKVVVSLVPRIRRLVS